MNALSSTASFWPCARVRFFNVIPEIDVFMEDGSTKEEWKMMAETKKILDPKIKLTATCVRRPCPIC
jgi:aspartate-semialdehyde dehydrogenase